MSPKIEKSSGPPSRGLFALWPYALVLAVGMLVLLPKLGDFGFWDPWEPKYAEAAREMVERGEYIVPYYRDSVRLTKPILAYWGILAGALLFGLNEFGARIVGVCMALATMVGVFYTVSRMRGRQAGLISALVLGTVPQFYFISRQAVPDVYLFTSLGLCLLFLALALFRPDERRNLHFGISYACIALAVLAKGPVIIGTVLLVTCAIWVVIHIDVRELWQPGRRRETLIFAGTLFPTAGISALLAFLAYLFGTSPLWWGYSTRHREETGIYREQIAQTFGRLHLADIMLVLIAAGGAASAAWILRRGRTSESSLSTAATPALLSVVALAILFGNPVAKIFASCAVGLVVCGLLLYLVTRRFLLQEWLWPIAGPYVKEIGRQLLRFSVIFLMIAGPWHIGIFYKQGHGYVTDFLIKHNLQRAGETVNRSGVSEFYMRVLIFGYYPWSCLLPVAIAGLVNWWDQKLLKRYRLEAFLLIATAVTFTSFSGAATKFAHYLAPIMVPVCVLIGLAVSRSLDERHSSGSRMAWILATMLFLLPTVDLLQEDGIIYLVGSFTMKRWVPEALAPGAYVKGLIAAVGACLVASMVWRSRVVIATLIGSAVLLASYHTAYFIPTLSQHKSMKNLCEAWKEFAPDGDPPICFFGDMKHGVIFYTDNRIELKGSRSSFQEFMDPANRGFCVVEREMVPSLQQNHRHMHPGSDLTIAEQSHFKYVLIRNFQDDAGSLAGGSGSD